MSEHRWRRRAQADAQGIPVVFASRASYLDDADTVRPDNMQAAQRPDGAILFVRGHQRIARLGGQRHLLTRRAERVGSYCATLLKYGLPFHSEWVVECASSQKQAAALPRCCDTIRPLALSFVTTKPLRWGVVCLLSWTTEWRESGVDRYFEQQVSLAAFADVAENALDDPPIIWASTPAREIGYTAERILQRIAHDEHHAESKR